MRQRRPEEVIGEWGIRDVTPPSQQERELLIGDRELNPLLGQPLRRRIRNFRSEPDLYLASLGGPLPYMRRLRRIEEETESHLERLAEAYEEHCAEPGRWRRVVERGDLGEVNDQIEKHNRWFPIEARLPMDPRTRDYVKVGGRPYRREPLDASWALARFPAA